MSTATLYQGECLDVMREMAPASVDAVVSDPPYALTAKKKGGSGPASLNLNSPAGRSRITTGGGFMGKAWDAAVPGVEVWDAALRVSKPGAYLLAFGGTRTYHRLACAIEDAGWEMRDCISWLYGSGFPKSHNGSWGGTALKPGWEPILLARKPLIGTVAANVAEHGTGGLNVDGCRIEGEVPETTQGGWFANGGNYNTPTGSGEKRAIPFRNDKGRWPANVVLDEEAAALLDAQSGECGAFAPIKGSEPSVPAKGDVAYGFRERVPAQFYGDTGGASRFYYCAKASRAEREAGLIALPAVLHGKSGGADAAAQRGEDYDNGDSGFNRTIRARNHHPTVKPLALMRWLCRLITPPNGLILDPFMGSGTTGCAAELEGFDFIGIEREADYLAIAKARLAHWAHVAADQPLSLEIPA